MKHLEFDSSRSLYKSKMRLHFLKKEGLVFISLKTLEEIVTYSEKLFPGDDSDRIIKKRPVEKWFRIDDKELIEDVNRINESASSLIRFEYEVENNENVLLKISENSIESSEDDLIEFPDNPEEKSFGVLLDDDDSFDPDNTSSIDFDSMW